MTETELKLQEAKATVERLEKQAKHEAEFLAGRHRVTEGTNLTFEAPGYERQTHPVRGENFAYRITQSNKPRRDDYDEWFVSTYDVRFEGISEAVARRMVLAFCGIKEPTNAP